VQDERGSGGSLVAAVVHKRQGKGSAEDQYVTMDAARPRSTD